MVSQDRENLCADGLLSVAESSDFSGLSLRFLYYEMGRGNLRYVHRGRRRLIPKRALVNYLAEGLANVGTAK